MDYLKAQIATTKTTELNRSKAVWSQQDPKHEHLSATKIGQDFIAHMDSMEEQAAIDDYARRNPWPPNRFEWLAQKNKVFCLDCGEYESVCHNNRDCAKLAEVRHRRECVVYGKHCRAMILTDDSIEQPYYMRVTSYGNSGRHHPRHGSKQLVAVRNMQQGNAIQEFRYIRTLGAMKQIQR